MSTCKVCTASTQPFSADSVKIKPDRYKLPLTSPWLLFKGGQNGKRIEWMLLTQPRRFVLVSMNSSWHSM